MFTWQIVCVDRRKVGKNEQTKYKFERMAEGGEGERSKATISRTFL